jgi:hypothetical protein
VQIKQATPVSDDVIKQFCTDKYFRFLSKPRDAASWDRIDNIVREGSGSNAEVNELEQCGITVRLGTTSRKHKLHVFTGASSPGAIVSASVRVCMASGPISIEHMASHKAQDIEEF